MHRKKSNIFNVFFLCMFYNKINIDFTNMGECKVKKNNKLLCTIIQWYEKGKVNENEV